MVFFSLFISIHLGAQVIKLQDNSHHCNHGLRCLPCKFIDEIYDIDAMQIMQFNGIKVLYKRWLDIAIYVISDTV